MTEMEDIRLGEQELKLLDWLQKNIESNGALVISKEPALMLLSMFERLMKSQIRTINFLDTLGAKDENISNPS